MTGFGKYLTITLNVFGLNSPFRRQIGRSDLKPSLILLSEHTSSKRKYKH